MNDLYTYLKLSDSVLHTTEVNCRRLLSFGADFRFNLGSGGGFGPSPGGFSGFGPRAWRDLVSVTALGLTAGGNGGRLGGSVEQVTGLPKNNRVK
jgi:hypothetical protein